MLVKSKNKANMKRNLVKFGAVDPNRVIAPENFPEDHLYLVLIDLSNPWNNNFIHLLVNIF